MARYRVFGNVNVFVETFVEMPGDEDYDESDIFAKAYEEFQGISNYPESGSGHKLIVVNNGKDNLEADNVI